MTAKKFEITLPELDENGLIVDPKQWDKNVAQIMAAEKGIPILTKAHWNIIYSLRKHYAEFGVAPAMSRLCRREGMGINCVQELFCTCLTAWQVSGLPDPGEEAKSYLSAM